MIDETLGYISHKYGKVQVGVLATTGTREIKIYDKYAQK
jgi:aspartate/glutamate racemase